MHNPRQFERHGLEQRRWVTRQPVGGQRRRSSPRTTSRRLPPETSSRKWWRERTGGSSLLAALLLLAAGLSVWGTESLKGRPTTRPRLLTPPTREALQQNGRTTPSGPRDRALETLPIEEVRVGDQVVAQDPRTGRTEIKRVLRVFRRRTDQLCRVCVRAASGLGKQWLETTSEHPFWVPGRGWVPAGRLSVGDPLRQADGRVAMVADLQFRKVPEGVPVYNIETEDLHTYCVAATKHAPPLLVHNCNPQAIEKLYHYTGAPVQDVLRKGLLPGRSGKVFLTPNANLSPLQAQLDLALPPNRGLPEHLLEINVSTLRDLGIEISQLRRVGRRYNLPGGEWEATVPTTIPPEAIRPVR